MDDKIIFKVDEKPVTESEEWVLTQIRMGQWADLEKYAKNPDHRILRSSFLENLLTDEIRHLVINKKGIRIKNAIIIESLNLEDMEIDNRVELVACCFREKVNCRRTLFNKSIILDECKFINSVNFAQLKVGIDFLFRDVKFYNEVTFYESDIGGHFWGNRAEFLYKDKNASFSQINVSKTVILYDAIFHGGVDFFAAVIGKHLRMSRGKFMNAESLADFNSITVKKLAAFRDVIFHGPATFLGATIGWQTHFHRAEFLCKEKVTNFSRIECRETVFFIDTKFKNTVRFNDAILDNLIIRPKDSDMIIMEKLELCGANVMREFRINRTSINHIECANLSVGGLCNFEDVTINNLMDFRDSHFSTINLFKIKLPNGNDTIILDRMAYDNLNIDDDFYNWGKYLLLLKKAKFNSQPYSQLESFFMSNGSKEIANKIYVSGKRREWAQSWSWKFWKWPLNILKLILWDFGVRYGRSPFRAVFYSLLFIILGTWIFSQPGILTWDRCQPGEIIKLTKSFWYSLDLFLPLISLGPDKLYQIQSDAIVILPYWLGNLKILAQTYAYIHQLMGYILVSIGLAAVTGVIK